MKHVILTRGWEATQMHEPSEERRQDKPSRWVSGKRTKPNKEYKE